MSVSVQDLRVLVATLAVCALAPAVGCTGKPEDPCGLSDARPDVASGTLTAKRDGATYTANTGLRGYRLSDRSDVAAGDVTLTLGKDSSGASVKDKVDSNSFPICIVLGDSQGNGYASVNAAGAFFTTDGSHGGAVLLIAKDGDDLIGRFEFDAARNGGSGTTSFTDGAFRLGPR